MAETRFVRCDDCGGEGVIRYGHPNAPYDDREERCGLCRGEGLCEVEVEPVTLEELEDVEGEHNGRGPISADD